MHVDMNQFYQVFFDETEELLAEKERLLLEIDLDDPDSEDIDAIFRAAHSIKGGASTFGLTDMAEVTHVMETLLDEIRTGRKTLTDELVDAFLLAKDVLKMLRDGHKYGTEVDVEAQREVMERLEMLAHESGLPAEHAASPRPKKKPGPKKPLVSYEIKLPVMESDQVDLLAEEIETLGKVEKEITPDGHAVLQLVSEASQDDVMSIVLFMLEPDDVSVTGTVLSTPDDEEGEEGALTDEERGYGFFDNITLADQGDSAAADLTVTEVKKRQAKDESRARRAARAPSSASGSSSMRVGVDKVDQLINLVGELVITQAMLQQQTSTLDPMANQRLLDSISQLSRNSRDLQQAVMSMRMMPMDYVFSRFPRMVHDLAAKLGKKVEIVTAGAATELDKGLIERIIDPLTHLVRNSVDHGVEMPDVRQASGKSETGKLFLSASHQGGNILIEVSDDGAGLNREKILEKAASSGLAVSDTMTDTDVWNLIFAPGFSTAEVVTDVSGRGVGMDVVKRNITELGGYVDIRSSRAMGTSLSVYLPLTLAILDGMSIRTGDEIYILPLGYVVESLQPHEKDIKEVRGRGKVIKVRGEYLTYLSLAEIFDVIPHARTPSEGIAVILEADGMRAAFLVDELVGQQQVVVKNLETNYRKVPNISGATIMGDGEVALIVDVSSLLRSIQNSHDLGGF